MNSLTIVAFFAALAATNAGIIQGPSSRSTVAGPDGSVISSVAPGGQIITEEHPGVVAHSAPVVAYTAPVVSAYSSPVVSAYSAPVVSAYSSPVVSAYSAPWVSPYATPVFSGYSAHAVPAVYASGAIAHNSVDTVVAGPSGTIATSKSSVAPTVYAQGIHGLYF